MQPIVISDPDGTCPAVHCGGDNGVMAILMMLTFASATVAVVAVAFRRSLRPVSIDDGDEDHENAMLNVIHIHVCRLGIPTAAAVV